MNRFLAASLGAFAVSAPFASPSLAQPSFAPPGFAQSGFAQPCDISPAVYNDLQGQLAAAVAGGNGGFFTPNNMWSAVVDRRGRLCSVVASDPDAWPGSRAIAIAKATTANGFSNSQLALSTALLYSLVQPGGSLYGLNNSNPFNPAFQAQGTGIGSVPGGIITFGGGVPLYVQGRVIGGLGISGDTSCADHSAAFKMRRLAGLNGTPGAADADNVQYPPLTTPPTPPTGLQHPRCVGNEVAP